MSFRVKQPMSRCAAYFIVLFVCWGSFAHADAFEDAHELYEGLKSFRLSEERVVVSDLKLKRDRATFHFHQGVFYLEEPLAGEVRGLVFIGRGTFRAETPPTRFERDHVLRMMKAEQIESDFQSVVLRFSDDTWRDLASRVSGLSLSDSGERGRAQRLALDVGSRMLRETGANLSARLVGSILNKETPGFLFAQIDGGKRGRFVLIHDHQGRIPTVNFGVNGGEKGLIYAYRGELGGNDVWMAYYDEEDYRSGRVNYSDHYDLVAVRHYQIEVDVREPKKRLAVQVRMEFESLTENVRVVPFALNESLPDFRSMRLKNGMRLRSVRDGDGDRAAGLQEEWEGGMTLLLPRSLKRGEKFSAVVELEGDFMFDSPRVDDCFYPLVNSQWYPRHGYLRRSAFDLTFRHDKGFRVASAGDRVSEEIMSGDKPYGETRWKVNIPISFVTFAVGRFDRHQETARQGSQEIPIEFYSLPKRIMPVKEDFVMAEMMNSLNFFTAMFGPYPHGKLTGVYHPRGFGQGFPSFLLLPASDRASKYTYAFIAHETAHQWWGNIVSWRSYRDLWLSEGFAEYSGILYTALRDKPKAARELTAEMRRSLLEPPVTETGIGKGRLADVGPLIMGHRLDTRETQGAYNSLIYNKGALVLRMLHFLFTDPSTGQGDAFFEMMRDFVIRYQNLPANTEGFLEVANQHFPGTPIAKRYGLENLNWFFHQWLFDNTLPSYQLEYRIGTGADGRVEVSGSILQEGAPENFFMPLPVVFTFDRDQTAISAIHAYGPRTQFSISLPARPRKVELDPDYWILSGKSSAKEVR